MRGASTVRLTGSAALGVLGLFWAMAQARPELAVLALPFLGVAVLGLGAQAPAVVVTARLSQDRVVAGDEVELTIEVSSGPPNPPGNSGASALIAIEAPPGLAALPGRPGDLPDALSVEVALDGPPVSVTRRFGTGDWGAVGPFAVSVTTRDRLGCRERTFEVTGPPLRVLPSEQRLREILAPRALRSITGVHASRQRGDGIEFADTRPFRSGDRARSVNWRVSARRDELWVDERHPERAGEIVLFLDSFVGVGEHPDTTLRRSVDVAVALARRYVSVNDRIGLVDLGGVFRWFRAAGGTAALYRLVEALVATELYASSADKTIDVLPARALPRRSLVVALTPLVDDRAVAALTTMRASGFDVAVIEASPVPLVGAAEARRSVLARRLWLLERDAVRSELRRQHIAVASWDGRAPLDPLLGELLAFREAVLRWAR